MRTPINFGEYYVPAPQAARDDELQTKVDSLAGVIQLQIHPSS